MNKSINAIRFLGLDAINKANSGHPGIVLGAAPMMHTLYTKFMHVTPTEPNWFNRDRFVLSAGHGSAMLYATLHLSGYDVTKEDLMQFRQLNSRTPGHPEYGHTEGVDTTTGPLGQGISMAAGMAIAEEYLAATFNKKDYPLVDHFTYVLCGDGDLQEGVTQETMSLAGHLGLGKLIVLYDSNDIQLDGPLEWANSENVREKYKAMNWHYMKVLDANNILELQEAINVARGVTDQPSIIEVKSVIGYGSENAGDSATHGAPLGLEETSKMRERMNYPYDLFEAPQEAYDDFRVNTKERTDLVRENWYKLLEKYQAEYPDLYAEFKAILEGTFDLTWSHVLPHHKIGTKEASRVSGGKAITALSEAILALIGGSADLTKSTKAKGINGNFSHANPTGRNINYGVREHAMGAIANGMTLHGLRGFTGGFFVFSDYMKPAMRMAAIMNIPTIFIFTHDSVAVGEDGPTHEPIEQLSMLRTTPNMTVFRPADANETSYCFRMALEHKTGPSVIVLSRQALEVKVPIKWSDVTKGGYVISDAEDFEGILIATGSEVGLALDTQKALQEEGIFVRVVSMPSVEVFKRQTKAYQEKVLPSSCTKRLAIEMGAPDLWYQFASTVKGIDRFGVSAPGSKAIEFFGFDVQTISKLYKSL
jgi:transketolase